MSVPSKTAGTAGGWFEPPVIRPGARSFRKGLLLPRELVYTGFMSLDGVLDSPGGTAEGHRSGGWIAETEFVPEAFSLKSDELTETAALMFGRRSYEAFAPIWPGSEDHAAYKELPKFVVSSSLADDALVDGWGPITILRSADEVAELKREEGGAIFHPRER